MSRRLTSAACKLALLAWLGIAAACSGVLGLDDLSPRPEVAIPDGSFGDAETKDAPSTSDVAQESAADAGLDVDASDGGNDAMRDAGPLSLRTGLLAYWPFDGDAKDVSGNGYDLTLVGAATIAAGRFGNGLAMNGVPTSYAERPSSDSAFDFGAGSYSISVWLRYADVTNEQAIVEKFEGTVGPGWSFTKKEQQELHFVAPGVEITSATGLFTNGTWVHVATVRDGQAVTHYIDGALVKTGTLGTIPSTARPLLVGRRNNGDARPMPFHGVMDDLAIWSRALDDAEIKALAAGRGIPSAP